MFFVNIYTIFLFTSGITQLLADATAAWLRATTIPVRHQVAIGNSILMVCRTCWAGREFANSILPCVSVELELPTKDPDYSRLGMIKEQAKDSRARSSPDSSPTARVDAYGPCQAGLDYHPNIAPSM